MYLSNGWTGGGAELYLTAQVVSYVGHRCAMTEDRVEELLGQNIHTDGDVGCYDLRSDAYGECHL